MREENQYKIEVHVAGICFKDNQVLVVKRSSKRKIYPNLWECGGGQVNPGENFVDAVKRQLQEELGVIATPLKVLGIYQILTPDLEQKKIPGVKFICKIESLEGKTPRITEEHSEFRFLSRSELENSDLEFIPGVKEEILEAFSSIENLKANPTIIHSEGIKEIIFPNKEVKDIINEESWPFSVAIVKKIGEDQKVGFDPESDLIYYVLEGESKNFINGKESVIKKGDFIILPKGTKYKNLGGVTLLAISYPRFDGSKRVYSK